MIVVEGMLLLGGGSTFQFGIPVLSGEAAQLGPLGVALGLGIVAVGFFLHESDARRRGPGFVVVVLACLSALAGGGFTIGLVLAVSGGLIAILAEPTPLYHPGRQGHH